MQHSSQRTENHQTIRQCNKGQFVVTEWYVTVHYVWNELTIVQNTHIYSNRYRLCSCLPTYHLLPTYVKTLPSSRHGNDYIFCNFQADKKIWCATLQQSNNCFYIHYIHTGTIKTMKKPGTTNTYLNMYLFSMRTS